MAPPEVAMPEPAMASPPNKPARDEWTMEVEFFTDPNDPGEVALNEAIWLYMTSDDDEGESMAPGPVPGTTLEDALAQAELLAGEIMAEHGLPSALGWFVQEPSGRWVEVEGKPSIAEAKERGWTGVAVHPAFLAASGTPEAVAYLALVKARMVREAIARGEAENAAWHAVTVGRLVERLAR